MTMLESRVMDIVTQLRDELTTTRVLIAGGVITIVVVGSKLFKTIHEVRKQNKSLASIPGPKIPGFFGDASLFWDPKLQKPSASLPWKVLPELADRYREHGMYTLRFGFVTGVHVFRAEAFEAILTKSSLIEKADDYEIIGEWLGNGLLTSKGDKWRSHRKLLTNAFHFKILDDFIPVINEHAMVLRDHLAKKDIEDDSSKLIILGMLDTIMETAMGIKFDSINNPDLPYVQAITQFAELLMERLFNPLYSSKVLFYFSPDGFKFRRLIRTMQQFTNEIIRNRKAEILNAKKNGVTETQIKVKSKKRLAFLDLILEHHLNGQLTEQEVREQMDTFTFAGHDTTGTAITYALLLIGLHPEVLSRIHDELDDVFGSDRDRHVTPDDIKQLTYLDCVLKESLRLLPSAPMIMRKLAEDVTIKNSKTGVDVVLPKGTDLGLAIFLLHRDPEQFPNPNQFDPDRFDVNNSSGRHPFAYTPFSGGPRSCIGQRFAQIEEKIVVANILRKYSVKSLDKVEDITFATEIVLRNKSKIRLQFTERD